MKLHRRFKKYACLGRGLLNQAEAIRVSKTTVQSKLVKLLWQKCKGPPKHRWSKNAVPFKYRLKKEGSSNK
jgi:hypothetical protein